MSNRNRKRARKDMDLDSDLISQSSHESSESEFKNENIDYLQSALKSDLELLSTEKFSSSSKMKKNLLFSSHQMVFTNREFDWRYLSLSTPAPYTLFIRDLTNKNMNRMSFFHSELLLPHRSLWAEMYNHYRIATNKEADDFFLQGNALTCLTTLKDEMFYSNNYTKNGISGNQFELLVSYPQSGLLSKPKRGRCGIQIT